MMINKFKRVHYLLFQIQHRGLGRMQTLLGHSVFFRSGVPKSETMMSQPVLITLKMDWHGSGTVLVRFFLCVPPVLRWYGRGLVRIGTVLVRFLFASSCVFFFILVR